MHFKIMPDPLSGCNPSFMPLLPLSQCPYRLHLSDSASKSGVGKGGNEVLNVHDKLLCNIHVRFCTGMSCTPVGEVDAGPAQLQYMCVWNLLVLNLLPEPVKVRQICISSRVCQNADSLLLL